MNAASGGRAFAGDHAIAHHGQGFGGGVPAGIFEVSMATIGSTDVAFKVLATEADIDTLLISYF